MSEPESRLPTPGKIPSGTTSVGTLPPLTLPPPRLDPLAGISSVHHSYASPSLGTQMMPSPVLQTGVMSPVSEQSPIGHQIVSPQQKCQPVSLTGGQVPSQQNPQEIRRQSISMAPTQEQIRGQFSHTVTTVPSSKRPSEMGRQIQSVPNSPASLAVSTPPQSVQPRHGSLDTQPSPESSSNPSPSYSNHSSPSVVQLHNGHGPPSTYVQSSTLHSHGLQPSARFSSSIPQGQLQHHVHVGCLSSAPNKQVYQQDAQPRSVGVPVMSAPQQRSIQVAGQLSQPQSCQPPSLLQQQLCARNTRVPSQNNACPDMQSNVVVQQQPITQFPVAHSQQNGQQCNAKARTVTNQDTLSRKVQSTATVQQQHAVMGLLHGAQLQQQQADVSTGYCPANVSNPHVRQILATRTAHVLTGPSGPSSSQQVATHLQSSSPPRMSPSTIQHQIVVPHGILPSQANLPLRSVLAAQHQLTQQQLLQQQRAPQQVQVQQTQSQQQLRLSGRVVGTASGALATLYDSDKSAATLTNKDAYRILKRRFKYLVYENECYQEELRNLQRKLLKLSRDKNFLLDRLGQFEKFSESSDEDSDASNKTCDEKPKPKKRIRPAQRKRAAEESLEGQSAAKRSTEEGAASSPSPSDSPLLDSRIIAAGTSQHPNISYKNPTHSVMERTGASSDSVTGSSYSAAHQGLSSMQPQQQVLRSTLARVVPSSMLAHQSHTIQQATTSTSRSHVDARSIMTKVRVESNAMGSVSTGYQAETFQKKAHSKDSPNILPLEFVRTPHEAFVNPPVNGDNLPVSSGNLVTSTVSSAAASSEPNRIVQPASSMSPYRLLNGLLPEASSVADTKEDIGASALLSPQKTHYR